MLRYQLPWWNSAKLFENLLISPNNDCSGGTAQYKVECLLESAEFESFTKGRRTSLKIAAVATAALEIFGASCLFGWFARFDDFSVALNFLERTVPLKRLQNNVYS